MLRLGGTVTVTVRRIYVEAKKTSIDEELQFQSPRILYKQSSKK